MAYGEKYYYEFYWDHDSTKNRYKVSFLIDGYASTSTELTPGTNPFEKAIKGQKDSIDQVVLGSEGRMEFITDTSSINTYDTDFLNITYGDVIVKLIKDPSGTPSTVWTGIIIPENSQRNYFGETIRYNLSAVDGLGDLKNRYFTDDGTKTGSVFNGFDSLLDYIKEALSKVATFSELQHDIKVQLGTYSNLMTSTEQALKETKLLVKCFQSQILTVMQNQILATKFCKRY